MTIIADFGDWWIEAIWAPAQVVANGTNYDQTVNLARTGRCVGMSGTVNISTGTLEIGAMEILDSDGSQITQNKIISAVRPIIRNISNLGTPASTTMAANVIVYMKK